MLSMRSLQGMPGRQSRQNLDRLLILWLEPVSVEQLAEHHIHLRCRSAALNYRWLFERYDLPEPIGLRNGYAFGRKSVQQT